MARKEYLVFWDKLSKYYFIASKLNLADGVVFEQRSVDRVTCDAPILRKHMINNIAYIGRFNANTVGWCENVYCSKGIIYSEISEADRLYLQNMLNKNTRFASLLNVACNWHNCICNRSMEAKSICFLNGTGTRYCDKIVPNKGDMTPATQAALRKVFEDVVGLPQCLEKDSDGEYAHKPTRLTWTYFMAGALAMDMLDSATNRKSIQEATAILSALVDSVELK